MDSSQRADNKSAKFHTEKGHRGERAYRYQSTNIQRTLDRQSLLVIFVSYELRIKYLRWIKV